MSEPLTMSADREAVAMTRCPNHNCMCDTCCLSAELRAEREAHKLTQEALEAVRRCIGRVEIDIAPRDDTADWLAQVLQVLVSDESSTRVERDRAHERLRHSQEVSKALLDACILTRQCEGLQNWGGGDNVYIDALDAAIALAERPDALASSGICSHCKGTGSIPNGTDEMACRDCTGTGRLASSQDHGADTLPSLGGRD